MVDDLLYFVGISLIIYSFYKWATQNNDYFKRRGLPHMKPKFLIGNTGGLFMRQYAAYDFVRELYNKFPKER